jgi:hypothetical protein
VDTLFVTDLPIVQAGWVRFIAGTHRVLTVVPAGRPTPSRPNPKAMLVAVVPIAAKADHRELEIADTDMRDAVMALMKVYRAAPEMTAGLFPLVRFDNKVLTYQPPCYRYSHPVLP